MKVLLVGGTSAGHLAPMVAVAEALRTVVPGIALSFVCSDRPSDAAFLRGEGVTFTTLPSSLLPAFAKALRLLKTEKPDVVFGKGSIVSVPLCFAAWIKRIPIVLHESDAVMGRANRLLSRVAAVVLLGTDIGNPVRSRITAGNKEQGLRIAGLSGTRPILFVWGGSQGAQAINESVTRNLDSLLSLADIIHLTGEGKKTAAPRPGYYATEFGSDVLPHFLACSDLALSRAGAGSIAELAACGVPAILVPLRGLAADHQVKNAERAAETGAAIALPQERLAPDLVVTVRSLLSDSGRMQTMKQQTRYAARPEAARLIAESVVQSVARAGAHE